MSPEDGRPPEGEPDRYWGEAGAGGTPGEPAEHGPPEGEADKMSIVESLLFVAPEPLSAGAISEITGFDPGAVREILNELTESYRRRDGGVLIREVAGGFSFYARREAAPFIARMVRSQVNPRLTRAAMETMAIVAYMQPVSRGVVAEIRGVQSEGVIGTLQDRGLVQQVGKGGPPGYPAMYGTTRRFLERFGLGSIDELPDLDGFAPDEDTVEKIRRSLSWELIEEDGSVRGERPREGPEDTGPGGDSLEEGRREAD
ncbi:MAG: SMC-Scp complex subunit ScpB [Actinobacteria bacterium]|nr:SMC-Scp complex subunit ScpB [Actinomycetota bacterium]MBU4301629.1 SMC-Scp complex subunit ScpB [Actinomycetota bacterium]MBU4386017.1 SMC-Scp complex subunit ScpB [Actinomycetota bacterium]MCG2796807.1 SMC-Scp complex subunit ScpB [Actinomycetes bacterium]